jgi:hypothetical protein
MAEGRALKTKALDIPNIEMIQQASDFEQLRPRPADVVDLGAGLRNARLPGTKGANHSSASTFLSTGIIRFFEHSNNTNRRSAGIGLRRQHQPTTRPETLHGIEWHIKA